MYNFFLFFILYNASSLLWLSLFSISFFFQCSWLSSFQLCILKYHGKQLIIVQSCPFILTDKSSLTSFWPYDWILFHFLPIPRFWKQIQQLLSLVKNNVLKLSESQHLVWYYNTWNKTYSGIVLRQYSNNIIIDILQVSKWNEPWKIPFIYPNNNGQA